MVTTATETIEKTKTETVRERVLTTPVFVPESLRSFNSLLLASDTVSNDEHGHVWAAKLLQRSYVSEDKVISPSNDRFPQAASRLNELRKMYLMNESDKRAFVKIPVHQRAAALVTLHRRNSHAALAGYAAYAADVGVLYPPMDDIFSSQEVLQEYGQTLSRVLESDAYREYIEQQQQQIYESTEVTSEGGMQQIMTLSCLESAVQQAVFADHLLSGGPRQRVMGVLKLGAGVYLPEYTAPEITRWHISTAFKQFADPTSISPMMGKLAQSNLLQ